MVVEILRSFSFQSSEQLGGVSCSVEHCSHSDKFRLDTEKDHILGEPLYRSFANCFPPKRKSTRVFEDSFNGGVDFVRKTVSQSRLPVIVPCDSVLKFKPRFEVEYYLATHFRPLSLSGSSLRICSHGMPLLGLRLKRSARRSNSSTSSGDKPSSISPNSSTIWPATLRRSISGKRRICSRISVALIGTSLAETWTPGKFATQL
jgi:hypothetical protein